MPRPVIFSSLATLGIRDREIGNCNAALFFADERFEIENSNFGGFSLVFVLKICFCPHQSEILKRTSQFLADLAWYSCKNGEEIGEKWIKMKKNEEKWIKIMFVAFCLSYIYGANLISRRKREVFSYG